MFCWARRQFQRGSCIESSCRFISEPLDSDQRPVLLELLGHRIAPLNAIGFLAAAIETALWLWLEIDKHDIADRALHEGASGWLIRSGEIFSGPLALVFRLTSLIPFAAISFLLGALISRFGWIEAGRVSGKDPKAVSRRKDKNNQGGAISRSPTAVGGRETAAPWLPQLTLIANSSRHAITIEALKKRNHDATRTSQSLSQFRHARQSSPLNEFYNQISRIFLNAWLLRTTSLSTSTTSPLSRKKRNACCKPESITSSLREGGSKGFAASAWRILAPAAWNSGGNVERCVTRLITSPTRTTDCAQNQKEARPTFRMFDSGIDCAALLIRDRCDVDVPCVRHRAHPAPA